MNKIILAILMATATYGGTYDEHYLDGSGVQNDNRLMHGEFDKIIRYKPLQFENNELKNKTLLNQLVEYLHKLQKNKQRYFVQIIGYADTPTDDTTEQKHLSKSYARSIEKVFRYSLSSENAKKISKDYAKNIAQKLVDRNISKDDLIVESRAGKDPLNTQVDTQERELLNRVMVSVYLHTNNTQDDDEDGVVDIYDKCPHTQPGVVVDKFGCAVDSDGDGVKDFQDECPNTLSYLEVDDKGCPLDEDEDGVYDSIDNCPNTSKGAIVDPHGCMLKKTLDILFETGSDEIVKDYSSAIGDFAKFLKQYPEYNVIITGHTDSIGDQFHNMELSLKRARAVKKALVNLGVQKDRMVTKGRGELDPIQTNRTPEGRRANRRIEVQLVLNGQENIQK